MLFMDFIYGLQLPDLAVQQVLHLKANEMSNIRSYNTIEIFDPGICSIAHFRCWMSFYNEVYMRKGVVIQREG
jgi:hypothetical protein